MLEDQPEDVQDGSIGLEGLASEEGEATDGGIQLRRQSAHWYRDWVLE